jgi:hypothetical protein
VNPLLVPEQTSSTSTFSLAMAMARELGFLHADRRHPVRGQRVHRLHQGGHRIGGALPGDGHRHGLGERQGAPG